MEKEAGPVTSRLAKNPSRPTRPGKGRESGVVAAAAGVLSIVLILIAANERGASVAAAHTVCFWPSVGLAASCSCSCSRSRSGQVLAGSKRRSLKKSSTWCSAAWVGVPGSSTRSSVSTECAALR